MTSDSLPVLCGQLIVGGFDGHTLSERFAAALGRGERAGAILFSRNIADVEQVLTLNRAILTAASEAPFIAVDQEGGRVARLKAPFLRLPPMRELGDIDDLQLTFDCGAQLGKELAAVGFNLDFAPVMDVDSNPENPVIGDRSFGRDPRTVMRHGVSLIRGLQGANVLACAKHFPGHGDTSLDSHLALPVVEHARERLIAIELPPFRAAIGAGVASLMSAHVVYPALEPDVPATFSRAVCASLLRAEMGFEGVLFSDDLEMGAVGLEIEEAAVEAIWAGCDALLICKSEDKQDRALAALVARAETDERFRQRVVEAVTRSRRLRRLCPAGVGGDDVVGGAFDGQAELYGRIQRGAAAARERSPIRLRLPGDDRDPTEGT